ncbi:MAG: UDP-3-O-(3-hydroxymyristoyl)glucosamine N-acyltransferase, partial [Candidatus Puniceispirillaceae bacterium]
NLVCDEGVKTDAHCVIGKRGFGFDGQGGDLQVLPHLGQVIIGKGCDIGAGVTIDRGALDDTIIGEYVMIDNQCHIAHNVVIDDNVIILGQAGIAGSVEIGKNSIIGAQVGIRDHIHIADNVVIASKSGVTKDIEKAGTYAGFPAMPAREFWLQMANARRKKTSSKS